MKDGFIKVAAVTPEIRVADVDHNACVICNKIRSATDLGAKIIVFPELCITGYTCGDLFFQDALLNKSRAALKNIARETRDADALVFLGLPLAVNGKLYNVAAALNRGRILGLVSKTSLPNYGEFYEMRQFTPGPDRARLISFDDDNYDSSRAESLIPFGPGLLFECDSVRNLIVSAEICEDLWAPAPPGIGAALAGATVIANLSASDETLGKDSYRRDLVKGQSARLICGYIYANAGEGESTTDMVFAGQNIIAENGRVLCESEKYRSGIVTTEIDVDRLASERRKNTAFRAAALSSEPLRMPFTLGTEKTSLTRTFRRTPFVPDDGERRGDVCREIFTTQVMGLKGRLSHTGIKRAVVGISGGLDSTLALLVTVRAFDIAGLDRSGIEAVTMPCFGTTDRTRNNARMLAKSLKVTFREVDIGESVTAHLQDIGHDISVQDVTYENAQARERTQVLMDIANETGGVVIGTGDMSELALGWATYNGDHMSMYGVNASVPKTLVRHLVSHFAVTCGDDDLKKVLDDVLDTPVSPELLPPDDGKISQKTEDLVGPYELHDFFLYYALRFGYPPKKIYRIAREAFTGVYDDDTILKWLKIFYRRFFSQQFKRSCLPDGPKVGTVALSPRGDLRMPSDAAASLWLEEIGEIRDP